MLCLVTLVTIIFKGRHNMPLLKKTRVSISTVHAVLTTLEAHLMFLAG